MLIALPVDSSSVFPGSSFSDRDYVASRVLPLSGHAWNSALDLTEPAVPSIFQQYHKSWLTPSNGPHRNTESPGHQIQRKGTFVAVFQDRVKAFAEKS